MGEEHIQRAPMNPSPAATVVETMAMTAGARESLLEQVVAETTAAQRVYEKMGEPMAAAEKLGKWFAASGLFGAKSPEQGIVIALTCMTEGLTPLEFVRTFDIVEGKPSKKSAAMQAEFLRHGGRIEWIESTAEKCTARGAHPSYCPAGWTITRTLKELEESGVATCWDKEARTRKLKDNYRRSAAQMLRARVVAELVRMIDPAINAGLYAPEELDDDRPEPVPAPVPAPAWSQRQPSAADPEAKPAEETKAKPSLSRAEKVIAAGKASMLRQDDWERLAGRARAVESLVLGHDLAAQLPEDAQPVPVEGWVERDYEVFNAVKAELQRAPKEQQAETIRAIFALPAGSQG